MRYKHDCDACRFFGHFGNYDGYVCLSNHPHLDTMILRFGSKVWEYFSLPIDVANHNHFKLRPEYKQLLDISVEYRKRQ